MERFRDVIYYSVYLLMQTVWIDSISGFIYIEDRMEKWKLTNGSYILNNKTYNPSLATVYVEWLN